MLVTAKILLPVSVSQQNLINVWNISIIFQNLFHSKKKKKKILPSIGSNTVRSTEIMNNSHAVLMTFCKPSHPHNLQEESEVNKNIKKKTSTQQKSFFDTLFDSTVVESCTSFTVLDLNIKQFVRSVHILRQNQASNISSHQQSLYTAFNHTCSYELWWCLKNEVFSWNFF